jgi:hypothetical protein
MNFHNIGDIFIDLLTLDAGRDESYCMIVKIEQGYYTVEYFKNLEEEETIFSFNCSNFDRYFKKVSL